MSFIFRFGSTIQRKSNFFYSSNKNFQKFSNNLLKSSTRSLVSDERPSYSGLNVLFSQIHEDRYGGMHYNEPIDDAIKQINLNKFSDLVMKELDSFDSSQIRTVWFCINKENSRLIESLVKLGFQFHHTQPDHVFMVRSLVEKSNIPKYAYTNVGVGSLVVNNQEQILLVQEKHFFVKRAWKFPGGYAEQDEEIYETAERETFEETGIKAKFQCILAIRHLHRFAFDCSDLYIVCLLKPSTQNNNELENLTIESCPNEIERCQWHSIDEVRSKLSGFNSFIIEKYFEWKKQSNEINFDHLDSPYSSILNHKIYSIKSKTK